MPKVCVSKASAQVRSGGRMVECQTVSRGDGGHVVECRTVSRGDGGRMIECQTVSRRDGGPIPPAGISKRRQFHSPHICLSFGRDKSWWSLLSGVYAKGSNRSHTGGKCVTCSGLTNSRGQL